MKGIVHFISGIAAATFVPAAVRQAAAGSPILALGGLFGLLPDTLDFKFTRYLARHHLAIDPDPHDLRPQEIADRVAGAMRAAFENESPRTVLLHTARAGADLWRAYSLRFDPAGGQVSVRAGPLVSTAGIPLPGSAPPGETEGHARVGVPLVHTYDAEITIDVFSGPSFRFQRVDDALHVTFLPWHRRWTHSLTLAAALGLGMGLLLGPTAGLVSGLGYATHVLQDQLGHMGSNLLWPFTRRRTVGLGLIRSGDGWPNFLSVWLALALILFNLDRLSATPRLPILPYLLATVLLPTLVTGARYAWQRRRAPGATPEALHQAEILAEADNVEL